MFTTSPSPSRHDRGQHWEFNTKQDVNEENLNERFGVSELLIRVEVTGTKTVTHWLTRCCHCPMSEITCSYTCRRDDPKI
jgi:hypothetical protein